METMEFINWADVIFTFVFFVVVLLIVRFFVNKIRR